MNAVDIEDTAAVFHKAASEKDVEAWLSVYAEDASMYPPGAPAARGKEAMRQVLAPMFADEGFSLKIMPGGVEVAQSGDLGYRTGAYELTLNDAEGKPRSERGKWVEVWKHHPDKTWKIQVDIWNSDQRPPDAPAGE